MKAGAVNATKPQFTQAWTNRIQWKRQSLESDVWGESEMNNLSNEAQMAGERSHSVSRWPLLFIGFALVTMSACTSGSRSKDVGGRALAAGARNPDSHIDVMCIGDRINDPSEAFHYSYKYSDANGWVEDEAEITRQAMDITIKDKSGSRLFHGVRSDEASWNSAVIDLSHLNITAMSARLNALNDSSAIVQQGRESINGYDTAKYSIDTGGANSSDRQQFETLFGKGASEKGTAWMAPDGCVAKFTLDETIMQGDALNKPHYEIARIKR